MLKYINEDEYKELLGVESIPDDFNNLVIEVSNDINYKTFGRIDENNVQEEVKYAVCLIINITKEEKEKLEEIGNLSSQNIEGWSETYIKPDEIKKEYSKMKEEILSKYLCNLIGKDGNYLLYRGV